ncbi:MAG: (2E,6E)-farnesyl diphosphate synthase [Gammaproteobacteria bacterium]|nr:(2E,6E)-farnesyl diphosphate synthase [Gammaproteobacteria bacterium]
MTSSEHLEQFKVYQQRIESVLDHWLPAETISPARLHEAMRYSVLGGGKRVRPLLVYAAGLAAGASVEQLDGPAAAVEIIHVYSLIHDDLPAMDDDDLRRGKPTNHKAFDEATAILAGDALQALSFHILSSDPKMTHDMSMRLEIINTLTQASGSRGMAGGQAIDLASVGRTLDIVELENMHIHKTGALIRASVLMGAMAGGIVDQRIIEKLDHFAKNIGLAFQVQDDILDIESDTETLGKTQGADIAQNKPTYPSIIGMEASKQEVETLYNEAIDSLNDFNDKADLLRAVAEFIVRREH